jgi:Ca2+/Na+ antiporter
LPETNSFTLVDMLHGITLFYIFLVIVSSVYTLKLFKDGKKEKADMLNKIAGVVLFIAYVAFNSWLIFDAYY